jgi:hypothetical protein
VLDALEQERSPQRGHDALGDLDRDPFVGDLGEQHDELVAAQPPDYVPRAQCLTQPRRDLDEQRIASRVPEAVVHELEAIEIQQQHRDRLARAGPRVLQVIEHQSSVRQAGQRIVQRLIADVRFGEPQLGLGELLLGDVRKHSVPAQLSQLVHQERRVIAHPHRSSVAVQHAVLLGRSRLLELRLARKDPLAVLRMHTLGPQVAIRQPLLRREPQDRLGLSAHVVPAPVDAGLRNVDDRWEPLDQRPRAQLRQSSRGRRRRRRTIALAQLGRRSRHCLRQTSAAR